MPRQRRDYADDPTLCDRVFALLDTWIPVLSEARRLAEGLRWRWEDCSTPFVIERDGRVISHVGVLELPLVCGGEHRRFGGIHAVCTLGSERRRGLYRTLIEEALAHCDERYETVELCTEHPEYYEPFGFRVVPEHRFVARPGRRPGRAGFRELDRTSSADLDRLDRLLVEREPLSHLLAADAERDVFKFNAGGRPIRYCEALDAIAVWDRLGDRLELHDLVATTLPSVDDLLAQIEEPVAELVFHFTPDRLSVDAEPEPVRFEGDVWMVRGPLPIEGRPLMLPPTLRH